MRNSPAEIPVIDIANLVGNRSGKVDARLSGEINAAFREIGFLCVVGHGIAPTLATEMRNVTRRIFDLPEAEKQLAAVRRENYRGYIPFGFFTPNDGGGSADNYEGYKLHRETSPTDPIRKSCALYGPNIWPAHVPESRSVILAYWRAMDGLANHLLSAVAAGLKIDAALMLGALESPLTNMTLLHYPPQKEADCGFGIHPHKDTDLLTIIAPDPVGGLEVQTKTGRWISVECPPGGFVVNIGDMLEVWSGGQLVSTPHRVVNTSGRERYSFPYFAVPRHDVTVPPLTSPVAGFNRPDVHCGHWSAEIWRTNWPDESAGKNTPELGTLHDQPDACS